MAEESLGPIIKAIGINPEKAIYHCNLGNSLQALGRSDEAIASHQKALSLNPNLSESHNSLGSIMQKQGYLEDAVAYFDKAVAIKPDYAIAHNNLGITLRRLEKLDEAITSYQKAVSIKPDYLDAYSNLGNALKELGRLDEALASYRRALDIDPGIRSQQIWRAEKKRLKQDSESMAFRFFISRFSPGFPKGISANQDLKRNSRQRKPKFNRTSSHRERQMRRKYNSPSLRLSDVEPTFRHCQWLYGNGRDRNFCCELVRQGEVWCEKHRKRIFASAAVQKKFDNILEKQA
jgi:Tfp pilus assembly protein PilF